MPFAVTSCDPQTGSSTLTGTLVVESIAPDCPIEGYCDETRIRVSGHGFTPNSTLTIVAPGGQVDGLEEKTLIDGTRVDGDGTLVTTETQFSCAIVAHPGDARAQSVIAADDQSAGVRKAFTLVPTKLLVCMPPFVTTSGPQPCGEGLCPTLTADSRTVGVHWYAREAGYDRFIVHYRAMDSNTWTQTDDLGGRVGDVAINNLEPGTTYEFELLACHTHFLAPSDCDDWLRVGSAAVG
ncbi:MAG: fibronectin type III domain-containing protein [Micropruina sp.]|uniref:fibronectin type III domain-containing protein n=1 Tax=Micropruina sp. TaxID=2737536 RepID=UPI0039E67E7E